MQHARVAVRGGVPIVATAAGLGLRPRFARRSRSVCVALVAMAPMPTSAHGAVAGQDFGEGGGTLVYAADPGEANRLTISREGDRIVFTDGGAAIQPGRGCTADAPNRMSCDRRPLIDVRLEDGDDEASSTGDVSEPGGTRIALNGDQGDDTLRGSTDVSSLDGGAGRDVLAGGPGTTFIQAADILWFGEFDAMPAIAPARDEVTCAAPNPGALPTEVDAGPDDALSAACGPVATYGTDVIDLRGTEEPDQLSARIGPTRIEGLGGDDVVIGGERADGGPGNDRMLGTGLQLGGPGDDRMDVGARGIKGGRIAGQDGNDFITGSDGPDSLSGGAGRDRISGRGGNDTIRVRDGERDLVRCGDGQDSVSADRIDTIGRDCERTSRAASAGAASLPSRAPAGARARPRGVRSAHQRHHDPHAHPGRRGLQQARRALWIPRVGGEHAQAAERGRRIRRERRLPAPAVGPVRGLRDIRLGDRRRVRSHLCVRPSARRNQASHQQQPQDHRNRVKRNGSVGWIENSAVQTPSVEWEVHKAAAGENQGNVLLARRPGIDPASLALAADRMSLTWTDGGAQRDAPID
jgi:hypothetical protein